MSSFTGREPKHSKLWAWRSRRCRRRNVEIVKRGLSAFERLDVDALVALTTSDFELFPSMAYAVKGGSFRGRDGIETYPG